MSEKRVFEYSLNVPYADIDKMGIVYYANYYVYFEMARAAMLREVGMPYGKMEEDGVMLPVVQSHCEYKKSAHYDDLLIVYSRVEINGMRLHVDYETKRDEDLIVTGFTDHVCMAPDGSLMRPVDGLKKLV